MKKGTLGRALRAGTCVLSAIAVASLMGAPIASADDAGVKWKIPTTAKKVENTVTAAAHAMGTYTPEIIGANSVTVSMAASTLEAAESSSSVGLYGTEANENANPYIWNQYYNLYAEANGLQKSTDVAIDPGANTKGPQAAYSIVVDEYGTCPSLYMRADLLFGTDNDNGKGGVSGYNDNLGLTGTSSWAYYAQEVLQIRSWSDGKDGSPVVGSTNADGNTVVLSEHYQKGDENYNPIGVAYNLNNFTDWVNDIYGLANGAESVIENQGKTCRYGDPVDIAQKFEQFTFGSKWYILSQLAKEGKDKKTVAYVSGLNTETGAVTLTTTYTEGQAFSGKPGRLQEAVSGTVKDLSWSLSSNSSANAGSKTTMATQPGAPKDSSTSGVTCTLADLAKADKIILATADIATLESAFKAAGVSYDMSNVFNNKLPSGPAGLTMQNANSVLLTAMAQGFIYPEYVSPVDLTCYYYKHFLHLTDTAVDDAFALCNQGVSLPTGMEWTNKNYDDSAMQAKLDKGTNWYFKNTETVTSKEPMITASSYLEASWNEKHFLTETPAKAATCTEDGNKAYWTCSDCGKVFADADAKTETTLADCTIKALGHKLVATPSKAATCTADGSKAYWTCSVCGKVFADADAKTETTVAASTVKATGHSVVADPAVPATYTSTGLTEGSHCSVCGTVFMAQQTVPVLEPQAQVITVKPATKTFKAAKVKKAKQTFTIKVTGAKGKLTFKSNKAKVTVNAKGKVTVAKGFKGTAKITVKAAAVTGYNASAAKTVTVKVS